MVRKITRDGSLTRALVWQYFFLSSGAAVIALVFGINLTQTGLLWVAVIGFLNGFACYCQWRANAIHVSRTALLTQGDDLIALFLGYLVLREGQFLNIRLIIGILLSLGSIILFALFKEEDKDDKDKAKEGTVETESQYGTYRDLVLWVALYSVIWGFAIFSRRYFALANMSLPTYVLIWYLGSYGGAIAMRVFLGKKGAGNPLRARQIFRVAVLAAVTGLSLTTAYWVSMVAPITVAQPMLQVSEMVLPTMIGLWIFKERKKMNRWTWSAIAVGLIGGITVAFSY